MPEPPPVTTTTLPCRCRCIRHPESDILSRLCGFISIEEPGMAGGMWAAFSIRQGSRKCACRWSTYSITLPSRVPALHRSSIIDICRTYSHRPTPPACGQTFGPDFAAISITASTSLSPPMRQLSICTASMAPSMMNCLNMMRFWHISPVATCTGATPARIFLCPATSSGLVGSSMNQGVTKEVSSPSRSPGRPPGPGWRRSSGSHPGRICRARCSGGECRRPDRGRPSS